MRKSCDNLILPGLAWFYQNQTQWPNISIIDIESQRYWEAPCQIIKNSEHNFSTTCIQNDAIQFSRFIFLADEMKILLKILSYCQKHLSLHWDSNKLFLATSFVEINFSSTCEPIKLLNRSLKVFRIHMRNKIEWKLQFQMKHICLCLWSEVLKLLVRFDDSVDIMIEYLTPVVFV